jgi:RHS repeat-associated protein
MSQCQWYTYGYSMQCPQYSVWCDTPNTGRRQFIGWNIHSVSDWNIFASNNPQDFDLDRSCEVEKQVHGYPPVEVCGDGADEDCDGIAEACPGCNNPSGSVGQTASCTTGQCTNGTMTCGSNGVWSACSCVGCTNPALPVGATAPCSTGQCTNGSMICGWDGAWGACSVDADCDTTTQPQASDPTGAQSQIDEMNAGCPNGDWGGYDPIQLPLKSATTLPFTDFEVTVLRPLGVTRTYSSSDVMAGSAAGIFGLGWHDNWEPALTCSANGANCTVDTGAGGTMKFVQASTVAGAGALSGEMLVLYNRTEPTNLAPGGNNIMVRRPNGEFILFQLDGSELHFAQPAVCRSCMDASFNGTLRLTRDVDPMGRGVQLDFTVNGRLLTVTDDLGNMLSLSPSATCPGRAGALSYRAGTDGVESEYVTYAYDSTCQLLKTVVPSNFAAAPGKSAQLRAYDYQSVPKPGLLTTVYNEFNDPVTVFGYGSVSGNATSLLDANSSLSVTYPQPNQDQVVSAYGNDSWTLLSTRGAAGKATSLASTRKGWGPHDPTIVNSGIAGSGTRTQVWDGQYLVCAENETQTSSSRYFQRDEQKRVTFQADYLGHSCSSAPWTSQAPLRSWTFAYGIVKQIAQGVTLALSMTTKTSQMSVFAAQLAQAAGGGTLPGAFQTSETLDYDPTPKPGDPAGYSCGTSDLPVGGLVCRKIVDGYTNDANGVPTLQRLGTFFSYDARGRLVRSVGPLYMVGQPPDGNVDPVEEWTYWPDNDPDPMKRGRLHQVKSWPSGWPTAQALTTSFETYDVFGPTQVQDPAGGITVYTRAGSAGRVTRIDTPDKRHTSTRYYDGNLPRLLLLNGGSARRFTYDDKGRLHAIEPLSGDPEATSVTQGWIETRHHDVAGNTTLITRADAHGMVRWKQIFDYYWNGALRKDVHPEGLGYVLWTRSPDGAPNSVYDEENDFTDFFRDTLGRVVMVSFAAPQDVGPNHGGVSWGEDRPGERGFTYEYEPGQDALSRVWDSACPACMWGHNRTDSRYIAGYVHDDFGRLLSVGAPLTMTAGPYAYVYDARGNVVKRSGGGSTINYQYDGVNRMTRLIATRSADGSSFEYDYTYDDPSAIGRLHSIIEPGRMTTFSYDEVGRTRFEVVAETDVATPLTSEYRYDLDGDLSEVITPAGLDVKYERDPVTKDVTQMWNVTSGTRYASDVTHLPAGPITGLTFAGGATLTQSFNLRYEPSSIASGPVALGYVISPAGNPTTVGSTTYTYDIRSRVVSETPFEGTRYAFTFADPGPFTATGATPSGRMIAASVPWVSGAAPQKFAFGYDNGSNLSAISTYDPTGSSITGTTCLVHDALGRLTAVGPAKVQAGPDARACLRENDLASVTVRFRYDARNRRVARQDGTGPWKYWVFSPDGKPLAEMWKPTSSGGAWSVQREYVWLDGRPLAQVEYPGTSGRNEGDVYLVHVDHLGQPRSLTSMAGAVVWSSTPRAYGEIVETTTVDPANGRTVVTNLRLPGQYDERLLGAIGLSGPYYNGARWYLPAMARYMELDPVALLGGMNGQYAPDWYGYANQNPLRWTDPGGEFALLAPAVMGAVFGGIYGAVGAALAPGATWRSVAYGAGAGAVVGLGVGASILGSGLGVVGTALVGGGSATAGSLLGQLISGEGVNAGSVIGAGIGGLVGGTLQGFVAIKATTVAGQWGAEALGNFVGGPTSMAGELIGKYLSTDRNMKPWQDSGTRRDWLRAAGCKP